MVTRHKKLHMTRIHAENPSSLCNDCEVLLTQHTQGRAEEQVTLRQLQAAAYVRPHLREPVVPALHALHAGCGDCRIRGLRAIATRRR